MPISPQEQVDLDKLKADQAKERESFSSLVREYLRMDEARLRHCGSKTQEEAIFKSATDHIKRLDLLVKAHIKKYPD